MAIFLRARLRRLEAVFRFTTQKPIRDRAQKWVKPSRSNDPGWLSRSASVRLVWKGGRKGTCPFLHSRPQNWLFPALLPSQQPAAFLENTRVDQCSSCRRECRIAGKTTGKTNGFYNPRIDRHEAEPARKRTGERNKRNGETNREAASAHWKRLKW